MNCLFVTSTVSIEVSENELAAVFLTEMDVLALQITGMPHGEAPTLRTWSREVNSPKLLVYELLSFWTMVGNPAAF